jgi:hypothetical protein
MSTRDDILERTAAEICQFVNKTDAYGDEIDLEVQRSSPCFVYWV